MTPLSPKKMSGCLFALLAMAALSCLSTGLAVMAAIR